MFLLLRVGKLRLDRLWWFEGRDWYWCWWGVGWFEFEFEEWAFDVGIAIINVSFGVDAVVLANIALILIYYIFNFSLFIPCIANDFVQHQLLLLLIFILWLSLFTQTIFVLIINSNNNSGRLFNIGFGVEWELLFEFCKYVLGAVHRPWWAAAIFLWLLWDKLQVVLDHSPASIISRGVQRLLLLILKDITLDLILWYEFLFSLHLGIVLGQELLVHRFES